MSLEKFKSRLELLRSTVVIPESASTAMGTVRILGVLAVAA